MRSTRRFLPPLAVLAAAVLLAGCGERVEVPPAHIGKVLTKNGYKPDNVPPSKFRLEACLWYCDKLILAELSDSGMKESFKLFMPKDQLNMSFDIRFTMSIRNDRESIDSLFARIPAVTSCKSPDIADPESCNDLDASGIIPSLKVYRIYGQPVLREVVRTVIAKYEINEVASSREVINAEVYKEVSAALQGTPIAVKRLAFADIQFPKVIVDAKEAAKKRETEIQKAEADKQIMLVTMQTKLERAKADRAVRREQALAAQEENAIFSKSVTDEYLKYKHLEVLATLAGNPNAVFVPYSALDNLGLSQRIFNPALSPTRNPAPEQ